jgi:hypothetical protein
VSLAETAATGNEALLAGNDVATAVGLTKIRKHSIETNIETCYFDCCCCCHELNTQ